MSQALLVGLAEAGSIDWMKASVAGALFLTAATLAYTLAMPVKEMILRLEQTYDRILRGQLLLNIRPRTVTVLGLGGMVLLGLLVYALSSSVVAGLIAMGLGAFVPPLLVKYFRWRRLYKLEDQLVNGIRTLSSGVRAGLNLVQSMELLARNGVKPICQEFGHMMREYEHGISLEQAMSNAAGRIDSPNYRLVFSALLTHRERGGDLGLTLDRIAESIREIYRLQKRIETLTAPGRAAARWMAAMPAVILAIFYMISPEGVTLLFTDPLGKLFLLIIVVLNVLGFLWIRNIVKIDI